MSFLLSFLRPMPPAPRIENPEQIKKQYRYWRIRTFLALFIGYSGFYLTRKNLSPILHVFSEKLGIGLVDLGLITASFSVAYGVGKLCSGFLADRLNIRVFLASGLLGASIINIFYASLTSLGWLVFFWAVNGFCQSTGAPPIAKALVYWFSPSERAEKWTWWGSSKTVGTLATGLLVGFLLKYSPDWKSVFYVPGILGAITAVYVFWSLRDNPASVGLPPVEEYYHDPLPVKVRAKNLSHWEIIKRYVFKNPYIWLLICCSTLIYFVRYSTLDWATKFLYDARGIDKVQAVWLWSLMPLGGVLGGLVSGFCATKFFKGRCAPVILIYLFLLGGCIYGYYQLAGPEHMWLTCFFEWAIGFFVTGPEILVGGVMLSQMTVPQSVSTATGLNGFFEYIIGTALGANLGAALLVQYYDWWGLYAACGLCVAVTMVLIVICGRKEAAEFAKASQG